MIMEKIHQKNSPKEEIKIRQSKKYTKKKNAPMEKIHSKKNRSLPYTIKNLFGFIIRTMISSYHYSTCRVAHKCVTRMCRAHEPPPSMCAMTHFMCIFFNLWHIQWYLVVILRYGERHSNVWYACVTHAGIASKHVCHDSSMHKMKTDAIHIWGGFG
jgi:hypothetical protein